MKTREKEMSPKQPSEFSVISLFSGALGLDLGLEKAGFQIRVAVESNKYAAQTIRENRPAIPVIEREIEKVSTKEILKASGLRAGQVFLVSAGPSCQSFSTAGRRGSLNDPRGNLFREFLRVVKETRPRFFIMENVKGILSAAVRHRPLNKRGPGERKLSPEEELGSALKLILKEFHKTGYYVTFGLLNAADYGVPQKRDRVVFLGSRDGEPLCMPVPTHAKGSLNGKRKWVTLREAFVDLREPNPEYNPFPPEKEKYMKLIPAGGNWRDLPPRLQRKAIGRRAFRSWGGRGGFLRRLAWNRPSPALTTDPNSNATMLGHPRKLRPLSVRECAKIQQFPNHWRFAGSLRQKYTQIGNAVPVGLGKAIGNALKKAMRGSKAKNRLGTVICADDELLIRLTKLPKTQINPPNMRKVKSKKKAKQWLSRHGKDRSELLNLLKRWNLKRSSKRKGTASHKLRKST